MNDYNTLIKGKMVYGENKIIIKSPFNDIEIGSVPALTKKDIDSVYDYAIKAFQSWKELSPQERIEYINKFKKEFISNRDLIARIMALEIAKPIKACYSEFDRTIEYIDQTIECYKQNFINPEVIKENIHGIKGKEGYFFREPLGVVLAISPFNYPLNLSLAKIIPALLVGNTVVFKPATQGSIVGTLIGKCFFKAKLPHSVLNVVTGKGSEIGDYIIENNNVNMISFTGGVDVGKKIASKKSMIPLVLELGGKDAGIILDDVDIKQVAKEILKGALDYSGQRCTAIKLVYAHEKIANELINELKELIKELKIGSPFDDVDITSLISQSSLKWAKSLIDDAIKKGAKVVCGNINDGNILFPTLIDKVKHSMLIFDEEQFAPIIPIVRYKEIDWVIKYFNSSKFGLQGSIFSKDEKKAWEIAKKLNSGTININKSSSRGPDIFPFSGIKNSGFGVQGIKWALESMTRIKGIVKNKI